MANKLKGQSELKLGDKVLVLRPTFERLVELEDGLGEPLVKTLTRLGNGEIGLKQTAMIVSSLSEATIKPEEVGALLVESGYFRADVLNGIGKALTQALTGSDDTKRPPEPVGNVPPTGSTGEDSKE
jgi:hypothetical protein